jgi:hypothetical protein
MNFLELPPVFFYFIRAVFDQSKGKFANRDPITVIIRECFE